MKNFLEGLISYLTPFSWRKLVVAIVSALACALALYLTSCHVQRECRSFTTVKIDRLDTIEYNSRFHKDYKYSPFDY